MKKINTLLIMLLVVTITACKLEQKQPKHIQFTEQDIAIIPQPVNMTLGDGNFHFNQNTAIVGNDGSSQGVASKLLADKLSKATGWKLEVQNDADSNNNMVVFDLDENLPKEAYTLSITPEKVTIKASSNAGFMYGVHSLLQLLPENIESTNLGKQQWTVPTIEIQDQPRYQYRGLMLDVVRHFFDKEYVLETIDRLAMHKMNTLHLHLVDDQGWRLEIKQYPKLTEVGAWRVDQEDLHWNSRRATKPGEEATYGGFYTQEEMKEIVAYAAERGIQVIPEIEMPAHVSSAVAAYPELACFNTEIGVPSGSVWPITDIYCAGNDNTFEFLENVLTEVMEIFPSTYIHVGGDEATKTNWEKCPKCQARMKAEGLKDVNELQSYFIKRMEKFLNANGKKLLGWDEILEGGLAPDATVMSWRGVKGGLEAAEQGHDVVMTPGTHCYFDHYQGPQSKEPLAIGGYTPLSKVYQFDPTVDGMTPEEAKHVLGGQANLWAEYIPTQEHSEYMIFPRLTALSETLWSPKESRDWNDFSRRVKRMITRYNNMGINYAKSAYLITSDVEADIESKTAGLVLKTEFPDADIRYVLNDEKLTADSKKFTEPLTIKETTIVKASLFEDEKPIGEVYVDTIQFHKAIAKPVKYNIPYHERYQGKGAYNLVNTIRGSKNFGDGQWQAWLNEDMEVVIDLEEEMPVSKVSVSCLENQGPDIFFPTEVVIYTSTDGVNYTEMGKVNRPFKANSDIEIKNFTVDFAEQNVRYIKAVAKNMNNHPQGRGVWLFVDEIIVE